MKLIDGNETVVIVTGSAVGTSARDGPLAAWLREEIDRRGQGTAYRRAVVVPDDAWAAAPRLHEHPTIAVGGPGVNGASGHLAPMLPMVWSRDDRSFVQMATGAAGRHATLWGMDAAATREAVEAFVAEGLLATLLDRIWRAPAGQPV